jgi:DNA-binding IclR family transcriptional regulator
VKSAARVLEILEFFDDVRREASVGEIASRLNYPQSSTSVLLKSPVDLGYLGYDAASRSFLPTVRIALLGTWLDGGPMRDGRLIRLLEELAFLTGDTVILAARNGIFSQFVHVIQARAAMRFHVPQGSRRLLVWSATGFALLSAIADDDIRGLVRRTNSELSLPQPIEPRRVLSNVRQTREHKYFFSRGLVTPGAGSIAVALPPGAEFRECPLAVGISGVLEHFIHREAELVRLVRETINRYLD